MKKEEKQMSTREVLSVTFRGYKLLYHMQSKRMIICMVNMIWNALTPYVGIWFSARLIGELAGACDPIRLRTLILWTLGSAAFISLVSAILNRLTGLEDAKDWYVQQHMYVEKMLDMDFVRVDDPETHKMRDTIGQNRQGGGWGIQRIIGQQNAIISSVFSILGGMVMTATLFTCRVPESAGNWRILEHPIFLAVAILLMIAMPGVSAMIYGIGRRMDAKESGNLNLCNRLFGWFGFRGHDISTAANMRMYRIDKICMEHNLDKNGMFGSHGPLARQFRGKLGVLYMLENSTYYVFIFIVYLYVCLKAWTGAFGIEGITQYVGAITIIAGSVGTFIRHWTEIRCNAPFVKLTLDYFDLPNEMYQGSLTTEKRIDRDYEVEFRNVSFRYPGTEIYALRNVSMKFRIGERLAVVGRNGSGKTTFIKLLCRLYDPTEGEILLNNIDIRKYDYYQYLNIFAVVFQDFKLFPYTLGQNVAAGENYDGEKVKDCLEKVGFGERLRELEKGLETYLYKELEENGVNISGGEAQKIALARALYKDSPFIILDEPTAALDPIAEAEVYSNFNHIVGDRTAIYISHRLSSCRFCDEIAVFEEGHVVQKGSHEELLADAKGTYAALWNAQAQYYEE